MVICPKCKAENRPEAAFCARCGTILFSQPAQSKPPEQTNQAARVGEKTVPVPDQAGIIEPMQQTVFFPGFTKRPEGAVFGDRFRYDTLVYQDEHEIHYTVTEIVQADKPSVRICSNPACRTIHCPVSNEAEKYCTQCGDTLDQVSPLLVLWEADSDQFQKIQPVIDLHMVHPYIHPPVAAFQQELLGGIRYCLVAPYSQNLPSQADITQALDWGIQLSKALEYMHAKGIVLGTELNQSNIGLSDGIVVWRNFSTARVLTMLTDREKTNNIRLLALAMYSWMTGKTTYSLDSYLPHSLNDLFQKALVGEGFTSAEEFEQQLTTIKSTGPVRLNLDYQLGRRTNPGKVRSNNEDSMLTIELSKMNEGIIQPICLVAVADGMGGHASGEMASCLVIDAIAQIGAFELVSLQNPAFEEYGDWVKRAIHAANQEVFEARQTAGNDMGSTIVLGLIIGNLAYLGHMGDSRIYLLREGDIKQLTTDHSLVQHLISTGKISRDEARFHPQRNVIYRSLGEDSEFEADYIVQQLFPGDRLLFCSDGLTNMLEDQKIQQITSEAASSQVACDRLIEEANLAGGEDNISVVLVEILSY